MDVWQHLRRRLTIRQTRSHEASFSHAMWQNQSIPSSIEWMRLNGNDSHPSVSFKPLIEVEESNPTATPNLAYKNTCSSMM